MTITFFSNFLNHHQLPLSLEMQKKLGDDYKFVATEKIPIDRTKLGYEDMNYKYDFVVRSYENEEDAYRLGFESDVVIIGSAPQKYIRERLKKGKLTIRYSERLFKGFKFFLSVLPHIIRFKLYENRNTYLLCASAYSANDFSRVGLYKNKTYKWGYFPEVKEYGNINKIVDTKDDNSIIWVARFIDWKHPETVVELARKLRDNNKDFKIKMIGIGPLEEKIKNQIKNYNLEEYVELMGSMSPEQVRKHMEKSKIFIFTSDKGEGWGAVLNEAMNSGCAVVASEAIGSVPFMIENEINGFSYNDGDIIDLYLKVLYLLDNDNIRKTVGLNAYKSMVDMWNPKIAAKRVISLSEALLEQKDFNQYDDGPCSKANISN